MHQILRTSRFFPDEDDDEAVRLAYTDAKANEYCYRRAEIEDVVTAHLLAMERAPALELRRYVISATTPFARGDAARLRADAPGVLCERVPGYEREYARRGWRMFPSIDRVYDNTLAWRELGWEPRWTFDYVVKQLTAGAEARSSLASKIGVKGYHAGKFADGRYPVE